MDTVQPAWWRRRPGVRGETRYVTIDHVSWRVFEFLCAFDPPGSGSLIFVSDDGWRRLRIFPRDWATRDDAALFALSDAR